MIVLQVLILVLVFVYLKKVPYQGATQDLNHVMANEAPIDYYLRFYH